MQTLQTIRRYRNEFRLIVSSSAGLGIPLYTTWPKNICLTLSHPINITFQFLISIYGIVAYKILIPLCGRKEMFASIFCIFGLIDQMG